MERHALLHRLQRQRQFRQRMLVRQPLLQHVRGQHFLPAALGLANSRSFSAELHVAPRFVLPLPIQNTQGERMQGERMQGERMQGERMQGERMQGDRKGRPYNENEQDEQRTIAGALPAQPPLPPDEKIEAQMDGAMETERAAQTDGENERDVQPPSSPQYVQPVEQVKARPRRGRVEERPVQSMSTPPERGEADRSKARSSTPISKPPALSARMSKTEQARERELGAQTEADALFAPDSTKNRSPQEWFALLTRAEEEPVGTDLSRPQADVVPQQVPQADSSRPSAPIINIDATEREPLSQRARRFLRPLLPIEPEQVRVYHGPQAAKVAAEQQADAVAQGDTIALGAGHPSDTPETLALLAHEMTHVARQRDTRFVPPVANKQSDNRQGSNRQIDRTQGDRKGRPYNDDGQNAQRIIVGATLAVALPLARPTQPATGMAQPATGMAQPATGMAQPATGMAQPAMGVARTLANIVNSADEETLARQVEQEAYWQAQDKQDARNVQGKQEGMVADTLDWRGLPAPWEPLPDWLLPIPLSTPQMPAPSGLIPNVPQTIPVHTQNVVGNPASTTVGTGIGTQSSATSSIQRAGRERSPLLEKPAGMQEMLPQPPQTPEPDLDELARQVYNVLKRRLSVEQRRMR